MTAPTLAFDFQSARAASTATRINASGLVEVVAADTARFDFNSVTLACRGLLIEEQRTNLLRQSQNFGIYWSNADSSESVDVAVSPDGTQNADKLIVNNGVTVGVSQIKQTVSKAVAATAGNPAAGIPLVAGAAGAICAWMMWQAWPAGSS